jgi:DNA-binding response OmpR family regulator
MSLSDLTSSPSAAFRPHAEAGTNPMEVLFLLIERPRQLVTREEIIEKLWGKNVFLDTDNAINTAIRKIRQVLRDDPEQPRFLQTGIGRGYRFIG